MAKKGVQIYAQDSSGRGELKKISGQDVNGNRNLNTASTILNIYGDPVSAQHPFPTDGDSVYNKDIKTSLDDIGTFTGTISSLFNNLDNVITDTTNTNPKYFEFFLERPINSGTFGLNTSSGNFSNVKIILKNRQDVTIFTHDDSSNDTKYTNKSYGFTTKNFCCVRIEFHTTDTVKLSGILIPKNWSVSIDKIDGLISKENSTETPLLADATFTGIAIDTKDYGMAIISVYSNVVSATDGLSIQFSKDKTNWYWTDEYTIVATTGKTFSVQTQARWMRVLYTNGAGDRTIFQLETTLKPVYVKPSSHIVADAISSQDDAELVKAVLTGQKPNDDFVNFQATVAGNFKMSLEEYDDVSNPVRKDMEGGGKVSVGTTAVEATFTNTEKHVYFSRHLTYTLQEETANKHHQGVRRTWIGKSNSRNIWGCWMFSRLPPER